MLLLHLTSCLDQDESQEEVLSPQRCHDSEQSLQEEAEAAGFLSLLSLQGLCTVGRTTVTQVPHPMFVPQVWSPSGEQLSARSFCESLERAEKLFFSPGRAIFTLLGGSRSKSLSWWPQPPVRLSASVVCACGCALSSDSAFGPVLMMFQGQIQQARVT